ncbi:MAG: efflux RND transporter permease subunit [Elusimicrobiota bacterium]
MIEAFVKRPAMTVMFVLVFVVLGIVSYGNLIIERTPQIDFPIVSISAVYRGASPEEIETQIIKKIEDAIAEISQIKKIQSFAYENFGRIMIEFQVEADVNIKSIEVKDKVEAIRNTLPEDAEDPEIAKFDPTVRPIMDLVLLSDAHDDRALFEFADKKLKDLIGVTEGVASVDVYGGKARRINAWVNPPLLKKHFLSLKDIVDAVDAKNVNIPGGAIDKSDARASVRMLGEFRSVAELAAMGIVSAEGEKLRLSDVATVEDGHKKVETHTRFNGKNAVGLSIKKLSDGDAVSIARRIRKNLPAIRKTLPEGMELRVAYDSSTRVLADTVATVRNIAFGILLTVGILFLFLGDVRTTIVAGVVIPTSLISTFFPMDLSDYSVNFMTLLGTATALGTLIANALVVIESVALHIEQGKPPARAAVDGTKDATIAVLASAGTNLVVFTPLAFMGGIVGQFMEQFGMTVVYATIFSILASFSLTPMLCALLLKPKGSGRAAGPGLMARASERLLSWLVAEYKRVFDACMRHPWLTIAACALILFSVRYPARYIGNEFMPASDQDKIGIAVEMPQGTLLDVTKGVAEEVEALIRKIPEAASYLTYVGIDGTENGYLTVNLRPLEKRERSDLDLINELIPEVAKIPDTKFAFTRGESGPREADLTINVYGTDYDAMISLSERMRRIMLESGFFRSVESSHKTPKEEIRFIPDDARMIRFGVKNSDVGNAIRWAVTGDDTSVFKEKGEEYDISITYDELYKHSLEDIADIAVMSRDGLAPIRLLGEVKRAPGFSALRRRDKERVVQLTAYLSKATAGDAQRRLDAEFAKLDFPEGCRYKYVGMAEFQEESNRELGRAGLLAVILTYMLLVAILNSFVYPLVIVSSIATSFVGVFYFLFFLGFSSNIGSMMAMVMLVGLAVNNAILMLDYTLKKMEEGKDAAEALWLGASFKFRAILMTSLAVIFGALPQITDPFFVKASMGAVIVGGMLGSILFTLVLIPVLFLLACRLTGFFARLRGH